MPIDGVKAKTKGRCKKERGQGGRKSRKRQTSTIASKKKKYAAFGFGTWPVTDRSMFGTH